MACVLLVTEGFAGRVQHTVAEVAPFRYMSGGNTMGDT